MELNPDNPLDGSPRLPERWRYRLTAIFATGAASIDPTMDFSHSAKLLAARLAITRVLMDYLGLNRLFAPAIEVRVYRIPSP